MTPEQAFVDEILKQVEEYIWGKYDNSHMGTFAEVKTPPEYEKTIEEKFIDAYAKVPCCSFIFTPEEIKIAIDKANL